MEAAGVIMGWPAARAEFVPPGSTRTLTCPHVRIGWWVLSADWGACVCQAAVSLLQCWVLSSVWRVVP
jgi:hypothetical protein